MSFWDTVKKGASYVPSVAAIKGGYNLVKGAVNTNNQNNANNDQARAGLNAAAGSAGMFASQGQQGYHSGTQQLQGTYGQIGNAMNYLQGQMQGQNSVSAEQLRQGLQQNLSAQRSMAASASPQNSAMAARTAAIQSGRLGAGMSGQAALAGIQERNSAAQNYGQLGSALGQLQLGQRGQDVNVALGSRGQQIGAYGDVLRGPGNKSLYDQYGQQINQAVGAGLGAL
jgi:hypothetical protein